MLSLASVCCAAVPAVLTLVNLREYREPPPVDAGPVLPETTVIVPARNEAAGIAECVRSLLAQRGAVVRVLVVDDASTDGTAAVVRGLEDSRVTVLAADPLPAGWNGKQHACWMGALGAETPLLCFVDADVRLDAEAVARMAALLIYGDGRRGAANPGAFAAALVSGFPWEQTGTRLEWLLLPLIHFVLLGLLPMGFLRTTLAPGFAAGCGQFLLVDRAAYFAVGGHAAIRTTMHDGLLLPRLLRRGGYATRLADLTALARCRMYRSAGAVWNGLAKNATEGLGAPGAIVPMTVLLGLGQVLPLPLLLWAVARACRSGQVAFPAQRVGRPWLTVAVAAGAVALSYLPRVLERRRFRQVGRSVALHPVGVATLLALQWWALGRKVAGRPATWKARSYTAGA